MTITSPYGFTAAGVRAGLKSRGKDLALVYNTGPLKHAAAVFTTNTFAAAPVLWSRQVISDGRADAVVLNSGGANACTGPAGFQDTHTTAEQVAEALSAAGQDVSATDVLVCSTGLIGERLNMDALLPGVEAAAAALSAEETPGWDAAHAIMTTDTVPKTIAVENEAGTFRIGGMAKGAGMLAPGMATMLAVITTDAVISQPDLDAALREAVRVSFNRADSDGCMSTNDTVIAMASGAHPNADQAGVDLEEFQTLLTEVCMNLAESLINDAEGHRHVIRVTVTNAPSEEDAETAARAVARSNLFKTAIYGRDPNWGRILSAVGTTDVAFDPAQVSVSVNGVWVCRNGGIGEDRSLVDFPPGAQVEVVIDLAAGEAEATILTNDLTHDYVHENAAYST
ncbi:bifunctional glutamate N-acetyltransferase/amino-acid acetyltransferase ArgJ [Nesterenkonia alkaliphila]|uniref:Arginine biosynthesis bifunctional protein ArgJ n=1 Tax=Nesterenkonia alkaliphila TaxID=1463631 RepID=A0A7K1UFB8_9MICC|nr:bifunctional glutamate N-acetyltransferase/amino-acid acetyltransferase ArgJ [Nesterenkonia alkaliphila]MVT25139.1 bifunctional glutamate N-acetyltransferase/amino-acid acetyltransferase ArgJ [Nesterenkonia alkaliphila]GFZ96906.1 arginine biosynthesis bifunctional protein ArgJ [Nesterenkonia alkaliphila]